MISFSLSRCKGTKKIGKTIQIFVFVLCAQQRHNWLFIAAFILCL